MTTIHRAAAPARLTAVKPAAAAAPAVKPVAKAPVQAKAADGHKAATWGLTALGAAVVGYGGAWGGGALAGLITGSMGMAGMAFTVVGGMALGAVAGGVLGGIGLHKLAEKLLK